MCEFGHAITDENKNMRTFTFLHSILPMLPAAYLHSVVLEDVKSKCLSTLYSTHFSFNFQTRFCRWTGEHNFKTNVYSFSSYIFFYLPEHVNTNPCTCCNCSINITDLWTSAVQLILIWIVPFLHLLATTYRWCTGNIFYHHHVYPHLPMC